MSGLACKINAMMDTSSIEEAWPLVVAFMNSYGFDGLLYARTRSRTSHSLGNLEDALILTNHPQSYMDQFLKGGLYQHAPAVQWSARNVGSISWAGTAAALAEGGLTTEQQRLLEINARYGINAGYTVSFATLSARASGGIGVSSATLSQDEVDAIWADKGTEIEAILKVAHLRIGDCPHVGYGQRLTEKQLQILELVADGKTTADIALLIERTVATVEKHLRNVRDALGVETTAQAILKAGLQNQFFLTERDEA